MWRRKSKFWRAQFNLIQVILLIEICLIFFIELREPGPVSYPPITFWIDCCPTNGNLLAACGRDLDIKIYDRRESKIVKTFAELYRSNDLTGLIELISLLLDQVTCVRWNSSGTTLVSGSTDSTVKVVDFNTGKILHSEKNSDWSRTSKTLQNPHYHLLLAGIRSVCFVE